MTAVVKWTFEDYWQGAGKTSTFYFSGAPVDFIVPDTTTVITATLVGGAGGGEDIDYVPAGGRVVVQFPVTPGETLRLRVGGDGGRVIPTTSPAPGGWNGGAPGGSGAVNGHSPGYGGGGATDIRQGGDTLADRIAAAGGGGGNSGEGWSYAGGAGGPGTGESGHSSTYETATSGHTITAPVSIANYWGGKGGSSTAGGDGGPGGGDDGARGVGGAGADNSTGNGGGGGGGGWYGGGGGGKSPSVTGLTHTISPNGAGGGGGSNGVADGVTVITNSRGRRVNAPEPSYIVLEWQSEETDSYTFLINPNDGGAATIQKSISMTQTVGPNRVNILQEGQNQAPTLDFSGFILEQTQLEALETWYDRRTLIKVTDDLGREYYGVFNKFTPKRIRRASNFWYHQYEAEFTLSAYRTASGVWLYGRMPRGSASAQSDDG